MPNHTPGPWKIGEGSYIITDNPTPNIVGTIEGSLEYYGGYIICESVALANTKLIAAAPDLYDVLNDILQYRAALEEFCPIEVEKALKVLAKVEE